jgi:septal ring factor EnvC (AmiA/AmiB activator)
MMKSLVLLFVLAMPCDGLLSRQGQRLKLNVNPIRRVVTMMQAMQKKIEAEGEKEAELFEKFMCYCKTGKGSLSTSIEAATAAIDALKSTVEETDSVLKQTKADLKTAQDNRAEAKASVAKATGIREKEAQAFAKESGEMKTNIKAMLKATAAVEKGMGGAFLQTSAASVLKRLSISMDISNTDREVLTAFLTETHGEDYAPASGEITGILKQMTDTMESDLASVIKEEKATIADFEALSEAKTKEIDVLTKAIETKTAQIGELGVKLVTAKEDLEDTKKSLGEDTIFMADLEKNCKTKEKESEMSQKLRAEELLAIADTIKILNDDDALELFKKTLPTPSLLQITTSSKTVRENALQVIERSRHSKHGDFRLNLISLALRGKKVSFTKVLAKIDEMVTLLKKEQQDDDAKKEYCEMIIDKTEDEIKELELSVSDLTKSIADSKEGIAALADEIAALEDGIATLDKQVKDATEQRKAEHAESVEVITSDNAAKELLEIAKNRLNKFYNPKMYKAPPKRELSEEERIAVNMGGTLAPTAAPGGIAGTGVGAFTQEELSFAQVSLRSRKAAPPPPPETAGAYTKKGEASTGVIQMMDLMIADLDKEVTETEVEEKEAQKEYEEFIKDSANKRASDAKSISDKEAAKTELEATLLKHQDEKKKTSKLAMMKHEFLADVHGDCDWLLKNFDMRKEARAGELDSLSKASAVLSGADYS